MYDIVVTLHILSATVLFGTGGGTAYYLWSAHRTRDVQLIAPVARMVVRADWVFTTPTVFLQPLTGFWLMYAGGWPWTGWIVISLALYLLAGACWLPVVWLQLRMRALAEAARARGERELPPTYWRYARIWFWLGWPAFGAILVIFFLMVLKPI